MSFKEVANKKPHAVCIPLPFQSHIKAMLKLAKLLHHRGFHITFVNTEFNHKRFLQSLGPNSLDGLPDFRFETIPDGLPSSDEDVMQDVFVLLEAVRRNFLAPFQDLLIKLNDTAISSHSTSPPVTRIVADGFNSFVFTAAEINRIPVTLFFTYAASGFMGFAAQYPTLKEKGLAPPKDEVIDWIPGLKGIQFQVTNPEEVFWNLCMEAIEGVHKAEAVALHTFDALEHHVLESLSSMFHPHFYAIGPLQLLLNQISEHPLNPMGYSLWKEETECLQWLNSNVPNSVVYVNFGSLTTMTSENLVEFAWGLANTKLPFFWAIRPDLVGGESAILPPEFMAEIKQRGLIASWCPQEQVLNHPAVGGFLTHSGWNSTIESVTAGVPMLCCPFAADQLTNTWSACNEWGIGIEIISTSNEVFEVKRDQIEKLVKMVMEGEKGKHMRNKAMEWKLLAEEATAPHGSSSINLDNLVNQMLLGENP